jgi:hypothetical protein
VFAAATDVCFLVYENSENELVMDVGLDKSSLSVTIAHLPLKTHEADVSLTLRRRTLTCYKIRPYDHKGK